MDQTGWKEDEFPRRLFLLYVLFYAGQAIYNTYLNLYLSSVGLSDTQIGMTVSVSTAVLLAAQLGWGILSDRARTKNRVLLLLYAFMAVSSLLFPEHRLLVPAFGGHTVLRVYQSHCAATG